MYPQYVLTTFTPAEAEKITTLNTVMQRDWRRRGFIPSGEGHARFDAFALAEVWVMKMLSDRGVGPQLSKEVASWCAMGILWHALKDGEAYEGDHARTFEWEPEGARPQPDPEALAVLERFSKETGIAIPENVDTTWSAKGEWLAKQVFRLRGCPRVIPSPYFIWWADGSHVFHDSLDEAFSSLSWDEKYAGPVIVLDLNALATQLLVRAGRALVHVEYPVDEDGNIVPPLQYGAVVPLS